MNRTFDRTDAFMREATASLVAATEGRYHRQFLLGGMLGSFRDAAVVINTCRLAMAANAEQLTNAGKNRLKLGTVILEIAEQVATAATELSASASSLSSSTTEAVVEADSATETGRYLEVSSAEIEHVVTLISRVAD
jgi:methyl-accepting chemotaxis protein